jgi:hypothetical protein
MSAKMLSEEEIKTENTQEKRHKEKKKCALFPFGFASW